MLDDTYCNCSGYIPEGPFTDSAPHVCRCGTAWAIDWRDEYGKTRPVRYRRAPALFLDLDGTVRKSKSGATFGPKDPGDVELLPNVEEKIWAARDAGFHIVGVTNQGVVGFGTRTLREVDDIIAATVALFRRGSPFHEIYRATALPPGKGGQIPPHDRVSLLRKPAPGMLVLAEVDALKRGLIIDFPSSLLVGDREEDKGCAAAAGVLFRWAHDYFGWPTTAEAIAETVFAAAPADGSSALFPIFQHDKAVTALLPYVSMDRSMEIWRALKFLVGQGRLVEVDGEGWRRALVEPGPDLGPLFPVERGGAQVSVLVTALRREELERYAAPASGVPITTSPDDQRAIWARAFLRPRCARAHAAIWCSNWPTLASTLAREEDAFDKVLEQLAPIDEEGARVAAVWCRAATAAEKHLEARAR